MRPATMADAPAPALPKGLSLGQKLSALEQDIEARVAGAGKGVLRTLEAGRRGVDALFHQNLKASSPLTSCVWCGLKHPVTRSLTTMIVLLLNLFVYYGDPATFSNSESYGTMIGDIWHGWFEPDEVGWFLLRWMVMIFLGLLGLGVGIKLQHWLRDTWHLALFGYDNGEHETREPLASQDGALFLVICSTCMSWWIGLKIYNGCMPLNHKVGSGMHKWDYAFFNLMLAGLFTFSSDVWNVVTVVDQMAQAIEHERVGVSQEAVGALYAPKGSALERFAAWFVHRRLSLTRVSLLGGWLVGGSFMIWRYKVTKHVLYDTEGTSREVGRSPFWTRESNTEFTRHFVACVVACLNVLIVMQDWDFPDFSEGEIKISALDMKALRFEHCFSWLRKHLPPIYVSGKWVNYLGVLMGMGFDWGYWFMTTLPFRPCDYAQLWESRTHNIYTLTRPKKVQERRAGDAAAKRCWWFTDNPLISLYDHPLDEARNQTQAWYDPLGATWAEHSLDDDAWYRSNTEPHAVLVGTGSFTGTYTTGELNEYIYVQRGAWLLYLMCLIPIFAIVAFWYLVFTHEKVHCFNRTRVRELLRGGDESRLKALLSSKRCCVCLAKKPVDTVAPAQAPTVDEADLE